MSVFRNLLMAQNGGSILPEGYQQLNYIKSTGQQGIETNWAPSGDDAHFRHEATMSQETYTDYSTLFGNYAYGYRMGGFWSQYGYNPVTIGDGEYFHEKGLIEEEPQTWKLEVNNSTNYVKVDYNGDIYEDTYSGSVNNPYDFKLMIFCGLMGGEPSQFALHDFKTYEIENGVETLVRHYIPALRLSDNEPGLYEVCEGIFYTDINFGTVPFEYA